ncbi:MAG: Uma2 family endonuclease [Geitlerinemataceae cyanobacterium]
MVVAAETRRYSIEEYLALEETSEVKHEYHRGEIVEMPGGTANHNDILGAIYAALRFQRKGKGYRVFVSDMQLFLPELDRFLYPDVMAVRGEPIYRGDRKTAILNPSLIVEVLSKSTGAYDRGEKFQLYRTVPSFREYLLFDQTTHQVEQFVRQNDTDWTYRAIAGVDASVTLESLGVSLALADIYEDVEFNEATPTAFEDGESKP